MSFTSKQLRYAHSEGPTNVCYSEDGKYIVTCGTEGDIRVWNSFEDEEPHDKCVGDRAYAVAVHETRLYVGTGNNYVQAYTFPEPELDGVVTRFKAPVTSISVSKDGKLVACGSEDMEIHLKKDENVTVLANHKAPVLDVALDPKGEYLASSSCDGTVQICKLADGNEVVCKLDCLPKSNSVETSPSLCRIDWTPVSGKLLAVPCKQDVTLYERNSWEKHTSFTLPTLDEKELFSVCRFSSCGQYLAVSTTKNKLLVWSVNASKLVSTLSSPTAAVCDISWNPITENEHSFCYTNLEGYLGQALLDKRSNDSSSKSKIAAESNENSNIDGLMTDDGMFDENFGNLANEDDDDDENVVSVEKIKSALGFNPDGSFVAGAIKEDGASSRSVSRASSRASSPGPPIPQLEMQPPFQPSSTPQSLQFRFMVWNDVGIAEQTNTDDDQAISLKFHDSSFHYPFRIANDLNYSMAALSTDAVVFASEKADDKASHVGCTPLKKGQEWFVELEEEEEAAAVAVGLGWLAVATDTRLLRLFTVGGNQREVLSLPGPVVCMAGWKSLLAVVFHSSAGIGGQQWLSYMIIRITSDAQCHCIESPQSLPMSPKSTLKWMGFSDYGSLCTTDSAGYVRLLSSTKTWHPIANTRQQVKAKSDTYFVLGVNECLQTIKVILCKGTEYPVLIPTPYMTEIPWKLPLCGSSQDKGRLEEQLWRTKLANTCLSRKTLEADSVISSAQSKNMLDFSTTLIKLFSLACSEILSLRAVEACKLSGSQLVMERAMKYAHMQNKAVLAEQIAELISELSNNEDVGSEYEESSPYLGYPVNSHSNSTERRSVPLMRKLYNRPSQKSRPIENNGNDSYSQDMFEDSDNTGRNDSLNGEVGVRSLSPLPEQASLLRRDESFGRKLNPFKKTPGNAAGNRGLACLSTPEPSSKPLKSLSDRLKPKAKSAKVEAKKKPAATDSPASSLPPFKEWFETEREILAKDNPTMTVAELTRVALKTYKSMKNASSDMDESFQNSVPVSSPALRQTTSEDIVSPTSDGNTAAESSSLETPCAVTKKRKAAEDVHEATPFPKKIPSKTASKLTGFFYKKNE
ncbi:hypothetical protein LSTR_LSTR013118 [Laodelphax striatellus]|uniref:WD repeat-containing protein 55 homolog n=1 Tax=Laodelphax striatellus TaxID=195883 RepID=A0A482XHX5_LAOST|nr:hypothetical protein LSTR_LSTR013118 [Laodelphax striatellus]